MSAPTPQAHDRSRTAEDEDDPVDQMIARTGCTAFHYAVQECMAEHQDWRKCQAQVQNFKDCMQDYQRKRAEELMKKRGQLQGQAS
ncbi:cytochrome c oxidase assembly factor 4 homolog, mitochondrial [Rana temporaria]|uniref:cytochrome c oxidase assembly factor 4 homolog, mitochondrial n=1 Tax=Rana temporaria TaxID=8407 RepID=UPI001AAC724B|nr:cytochrome c oxidase assembly factor 4 homolog, mitochondrial [Rana temporaria]